MDNPKYRYRLLFGGYSVQVYEDNQWRHLWFSENAKGAKRDVKLLKEDAAAKLQNIQEAQS